MHAVGWPGAFLRRCRVSYSPCPKRESKKRERKGDGRQQPGEKERVRKNERRSRRGKEWKRRAGLSHGHERGSNESFCLFAEAIEFAREERTASLARPVPGYRPSPPFLAPDIPIPLPHRGIANFFHYCRRGKLAPSPAKRVRRCERALETRAATQRKMKRRIARKQLAKI